MRVVLDTNVVVSGLIFGGTPGRILASWAEGGFALVVSPEVLDEYRRVGRELAAGRAAMEQALDSLLALVAVHAIVVNARPLSPGVCEDPEDDKFLAAARAGAASCVVSGDKHLLRVSVWESIDILKPRQFADRYLGA